MIDFMYIIYNRLYSIYKIVYIIGIIHNKLYVMDYINKIIYWPWPGSSVG